MAVEEIIVRQPADLAPYVDDIVGVYDRAFREPPYNHNAIAADNFRGILPTHLTYPDFEAILLYEAGRLLGFVYGHTNAPDQWWYRQIAPSLSSTVRRDVFDGAWVVVELAVDPAARRRGFGRQLLAATMDRKPNRWAVLTTMDADSAAVHLYAQAGFQPLLSQFVFPEGLGRWLVLARDLSSSSGAATNCQTGRSSGPNGSASPSSRPSSDQSVTDGSSSIRAGSLNGESQT